MAIEINRIVKGHRYDTSISILLATDEQTRKKTKVYSIMSGNSMILIKNRNLLP